MDLLQENSAWNHFTLYLVTMKLIIIVKSLNQDRKQMKQRGPPPQIRISLLNLVNTLEFSLQTYHNTIEILMQPCLSELAEQDRGVMIAALFISQKLHQVKPYSIKELCGRGAVQEQTILEMELLVLKILGFRVGCGKLLIDECLAVASQWDHFCTGVTCIRVRFFQKQGQIAKFAYRTLTQAAQKLSYRPQTYNQDQSKLSLAVVNLCIKQIERYQIETSIVEINIGSNCHKMNKKMSKMGKIQHSSTDFIIEDFMKDVYGIDYGGIKQQMAYAKGVIFGLRDVTKKHWNLQNRQIKKRS